MAAQRVCSIPNCGKPHHSRGWCGMHFQRWKRTGDPAKLVTAGNGEPIAYFHNVVMKYEGDDCLLWPFGKSQGYANMSYEGRSVTVSRLVCEKASGPPPSPEYDAAHSCGRGHLGCVTKGHLSWKTRAGNIEDMIAHGTARRGSKNSLAKLTEAQVMEIRAMKGSGTHEQIAAHFGISRTVVTRIYSGDRWGWLE